MLQIHEIVGQLYPRSGFLCVKLSDAGQFERKASTIKLFCNKMYKTKNLHAVINTIVLAQSAALMADDTRTFRSCILACAFEKILVMQ
jgi:hypothetical protein